MMENPTNYLFLFWFECVSMRVDPPDIQVEKSWIHSGEGFEAKLVCIVYADPVATVGLIFIFTPRIH